MLSSLRQLIRHRGLIQTLVVRELKARYRGSVLGYLWSFINPLLLLTVYTIVFSVVLPGFRGIDLMHCSCFVACCRGHGSARLYLSRQIRS